MEILLASSLTTEEKIKLRLKKEERSQNWLARKIGKSPAYVCALLGTNPNLKKELTPQFLDAVNNALPGSNFTPNLLPHEQLEADKEKAKNLFKDPL